MHSGKKKYVVKTVFLVALASLLTPMVGNVSAATVVVKQLGCGTETACYTTIATGIAAANDNDTVKVYPGTYEESLEIKKSIVLQGSGPQFTTIKGSLDAITVSSPAKATIAGFTIISSSGSGIYLKIGADLDVTIKNNYLVGNAAYGIKSDQGTGGAISVVNNVISSNAKSGVWLYAQSGNLVNVASNIFSKNGEYGIYFYYYDTNIGKFSYNDFYANTLGDALGYKYGGNDATYKLTDPNSISVNPLFIDMANGNYALQSTSPCKHTGTPGPATNNPDGTTNDMGAFGGSDAAEFWPYPQGAPIVTNLTATPTSVAKGGTITINASAKTWQ